ncbi:MAG: ATP-binding cassette domain-containing protein [Rhodospirillaceae bacterium]|nr:ATP-binding cassette domain-containing protein [Rhodospirillaceae bacterium]MBT8004521.1 ATP-binding cassette domain-containing protein [Rhodospirillales bacterium]MBT4700834.1 ATP-binding cassette domain-containing protein [Rhodospirillaceae bacterium]MBT5034560.1 ATP-binding cassette domain-containing protein [Rhodospirillaceae bacterium]MBT6221209.1 ATP-binding cassette domain-containing protein [Rhodospirillaceae bacterium]
MVLFKLENENLGYDGDVVLRDISVSISEGERVALVGESGAGKSTLLAVLQERYHDKAALIPQDLGLVRTLSVFHNVYMGGLARYGTAYNLLNLVWPQKREIAEIKPIVERLGLGKKLFDRTGELSGGQRQRAAVCRALFQGGDAVLGDEPVSAVDAYQSRMVLNAITEKFETVILAMHDVDLALEFSTRIIGIKRGRIALDEPTDGLKRSDLDFVYKDGT